MKHPEDDWERDPRFAPPPPPRPDDPPPFEEEEASLKEDPPEFAAIRRIELLGRLHHMAFSGLFRPRASHRPRPAP